MTKWHIYFVLAFISGAVGISISNISIWKKDSELEQLEKAGQNQQVNLADSSKSLKSYEIAEQKLIEQAIDNPESLFLRQADSLQEKEKTGADFHSERSEGKAKAILAYRKEQIQESYEMYVAHSSLRQAEISNPDSESNRELIESMVESGIRAHALRFDIPEQN